MSHSSESLPWLQRGSREARRDWKQLGGLLHQCRQGATMLEMFTLGIEGKQLNSGNALGLERARLTDRALIVSKRDE